VWALAPLASKLLYRVEALDPGSILSAGAALIATAIVASYLSSRRAADADPAETLRGD